MNSRRSFLRSLGVAVMAVSMDVLPRFAAPSFDDVNARLVAAIDALIATLEEPARSWIYHAQERPDVYRVAYEGTPSAPKIVVKPSWAVDDRWDVRL